MLCFLEPIFKCFYRVVEFLSVFIKHMRLPLALELSISGRNL